jgi:HPt (histidine-containing phosphotransfer) domain-containing protein
MATCVPSLSIWDECAVSSGARVAIDSGLSQVVQKGNATMSSILNITDLLNRVDNDRELLVELFSIFKMEFPTHLQRLSEAIIREETKQVETESHALKGMLLNLSASRAAAVATELERMGRENKIGGMKVAFAEFQREAEALLSHMDECVIEFHA